MKALLLVILSSLLFVSCQNEVGRYTYHVTPYGEERYLDKQVFDTKTGIAYQLELTNGTWEVENGDRHNYTAVFKVNFITGETSYVIGEYENRQDVIIKEYGKGKPY